MPAVDIGVLIGALRGEAVLVVSGDLLAAGNTAFLFSRLLYLRSLVGVSLDCNRLVCRLCCQLSRVFSFDRFVRPVRLIFFLLRLFLLLHERLVDIRFHTVKAANRVRVKISTFLAHVVNSDHRLVAVRVEIVIVIDLQLEVMSTALLCRCARFDTVTEVRQETLSIVQVNFERLVVKGHPAAVHLRRIGTFHEDVVKLATDFGRRCLVLSEFDLVDLLVCDLELIVLIDQL